MAAGARQKCHAASSALRLLNASEPSADLALRALRRQIEDGAVLQIEQARHMGIDERVEIGPAHQARRSRFRA